MNVRALFDLTGKVAVVTGATGGLGKQLATALAEAGADIVVASRSRERCEEVASALRATGRRSLALPFDMGDLESIRTLVQRIIDEWGQIDVLVNCAAAVGLTSPYVPTTPEVWEGMMRINVTGTYWCSQAGAEVMKRQRRGKIVNIASLYSMVGADPSLYGISGQEHFEHFPYSTSKGAILALTRDMAVNLARWHINVNAISPGFFPSPINLKKYPEEVFERIRARTPLRRLGGEDDLKGAVVYLSSAASDFVTGHNLVVDGGWMAW